MAKPSGLWFRKQTGYWYTTVEQVQHKLSRDKAEARRMLHKLLAADRPPRRKVTLVWHAEDVAAVVRSLFEPGTPAKYLEMPKARYAFFQVDKVLRDDVPVGLSLDAGYLANEQSFVSVATVAATFRTAPG